MFFIRRKHHLGEMSTKELLRHARQRGWSAVRACGGYVLTNRYRGGSVASAAMNERALRALLIDLIKSRHEAPP